MNSFTLNTSPTPSNSQPIGLAARRPANTSPTVERARNHGSWISADSQSVLPSSSGTERVTTSSAIAPAVKAAVRFHSAEDVRVALRPFTGPPLSQASTRASDHLGVPVQSELEDVPSTTHDVPVARAMRPA